MAMLRALFLARCATRTRRRGPTAARARPISASGCICRLDRQHQLVTAKGTNARDVVHRCDSQTPWCLAMPAAPLSRAREQ